MESKTDAVNPGSRDLTILIQDMESDLTSLQDSARAQASERIVEHLNTAPAATWLPHVPVLVNFFSQRLLDGASLTASLAAFHTLLPHMDDQAVIDLNFRLLGTFRISGLLQPQRLLCYKIFETTLSTRLGALRARERDFVGAIVEGLVGEKDPRNLAVYFPVLQSTVAQLSIAAFAEELFNMIFCYFPISFTPPPNDPFKVDPDALRIALRACLGANKLFAPLAVPSLLEKLNGSPSVIKDVLESLAAILPQYEIDSFIFADDTTVFDELLQLIWSAYATDLIELACLTFLTLARQVVQSGEDSLIKSLCGSLSIKLLEWIKGTGPSSDTTVLPPAMFPMICKLISSFLLLSDAMAMQFVDSLLPILLGQFAALSVAMAAINGVSLTEDKASSGCCSSPQIDFNSHKIAGDTCCRSSASSPSLSSSCCQDSADSPSTPSVSVHRTSLGVIQGPIAACCTCLSVLTYYISQASLADSLRHAITPKCGEILEAADRLLTQSLAVMERSQVPLDIFYWMPACINMITYCLSVAPSGKTRPLIQPITKIYLQLSTEEGLSSLLRIACFEFYAGLAQRQKDLFLESFCPLTVQLISSELDTGGIQKLGDLYLLLFSKLDISNPITGFISDLITSHLVKYQSDTEQYGRCISFVKAMLPFKRTLPSEPALTNAIEMALQQPRLILSADSIIAIIRAFEQVQIDKERHLELLQDVSLVLSYQLSLLPDGSQLDICSQLLGEAEGNDAIGIHRLTLACASIASLTPSNQAMLLHKRPKLLVDLCDAYTKTAHREAARIGIPRAFASVLLRSGDPLGLLHEYGLMASISTNISLLGLYIEVVKILLLSSFGCAEEILMQHMTSCLSSLALAPYDPSVFESLTDFLVYDRLLLLHGKASRFFTQRAVKLIVAGYASVKQRLIDSEDDLARLNLALACLLHDASLASISTTLDLAIPLMIDALCIPAAFNRHTPNANLVKIIAKLYSEFPIIMVPFLPSLIPKLLKLSDHRFGDFSPTARYEALQLLQDLAQLPGDILHVYRPEISLQVRHALGDPKRAIRQKAVQCRNTWYNDKVD